MNGVKLRITVENDKNYSCHSDGLAGLRTGFWFANIAGMSTVAEIEAAIEKLPLREQQELREWINRRDAHFPASQKLRTLAGTAKNLPSDLAVNHDHYLHGTAKRS